MTLMTSIFALFSLIPFQTVARITIIVCAAIFIYDPFPSCRVYVLFCIGLVRILSKLEKQWRLQDEDVKVGEFAAEKDENENEKKKEK